MGACSVAGTPQQIGEWSAIAPTPEIATHTTLMGNGKVLFYRSNPTPVKSYVLNPDTPVIEQHGTTPNQIFCGGHATLADGRVISVGGHGGFLNGIVDTYLFSPFARGGRKGPGRLVPDGHDARRRTRTRDLRAHRAR